MPFRLELSAKAYSQEGTATLEFVSQEMGKVGSTGRALVLVLPNNQVLQWDPYPSLLSIDKIHSYSVKVRIHLD